MMRHSFILATAAIALLAACSSQKKTITKTTSPGSFSIKGTIDTVAGTQFYTFYNSGDSLVKDSFKLDAKKQFALAGQLSDPALYTIRTDKKVATGGSALNFSFWVEPGKKIDLNGQNKEPKQVVSGSELQKQQDEFLEQTASLDVAMKQLYKDAADARKNGTLQQVEGKLDARYDSISAERTKAVTTFAQKHPDSYLSLYLVARTMMYKPDVAKVGALYKSFSSKVKGTELGKQIGEALEIESKLAIGSVAPDFAQNDSTGEAVKLSSLRGKVVLVDFWASWCGPCRAENPNVVKAYQQYHPKGFEILGVSLDNKQPNWLKAIQDDKLTWMHVSDLKGWRNAVAEQYHIRSIPDNFLLDKSGKIVARGLRGEELEKKLAELM